MASKPYTLDLSITLLNKTYHIKATQHLIKPLNEGHYKVCITESDNILYTYNTYGAIQPKIDEQVLREHFERALG